MANVTVTVNPMGGTWSGSTSNGSFTVAQSSTYTVAAPTKTGYDFAGWACINGSISHNYYAASGFFTSVPNKYGWAGAIGDNTLSLVTMDTGSGFPSSLKMLQVVEPGTSPRGVGWHKRATGFPLNTAELIVFVAKAPRGTYFYVHNGTNYQGTGYTWEFLTSMAGTGTWETYAIKFTTGSSGTIGNTGYYVLCGDASNVSTFTNPGNVTFNVAYTAIGTYSNIWNKAVTYAAPSSETTDTIYALWVPKKYNIAYNVNGGNAIETDTVSGTSPNISAQNPLSSSYSSGSYVMGTASALGTGKPTSNTPGAWFIVRNPTRDNATATITTTFNVNGATSTKTNTKSTPYTFSSWTITGMDSVTHSYWGRSTTSATTNSTQNFTSTSITLTRDDATTGVPQTFQNLRASAGTVTFTAGWTAGTPTYTSYTLPAITAPTGKYSTGWYTANTGGTKVGEPGATYTPTAATTLYAQFGNNTATLKYHINGGTIVTNTGATTQYRVSNNIIQRSNDSGATWFDIAATLTTGVTTNYDFYNVTTYNATRDGYYFGSSTANVVNASYRFNSTAGPIISADNGNTNPATINRMFDRTDNAVPTNGQTYYLYINWVKKTYQVTYNANGGSGAPSAQTKTHGTNLTLSSTKPVRDGYYFAGWSTSSTALNPTAVYAPGSTYSTDAALNLYAVWWKCAYIYSGGWKPAIPYICTGGTTWKRAEPYVFNGSNWK